MARRLLLAILVVGVSAGTLGFEFRTHNGVTRAAREYLLHPRNGYRFDEDFKAFLNLTDPGGYNLIDSRAGDPFQGASLDEDHREGRLERRGGACSYRELLCGLVCSKDHFHPFLGLVDALGGVDAVEHAYRYLDWAVRLYRAARCEADGARRDQYFEWAARALGHVECDAGGVALR